ncbi:uncharacterized protein LOC131597295 [Vicia villosa]|uniref:uncharacterized protein LOC131597295 n=1 Tax=Vicia villosa TaxID=3911 RepID=UPI00273BB812|nr:uncharacterized protein LOC131597295 [Vicia villosa]
MMFQMLQTTSQYSGAPTRDPPLHLRQFLDVAINFKIPGVTDDAFRLRLFPYSLRDRAKSWLNSLEPNSIATRNDLAKKFLVKYYPPSKNANMRNEITSFRQGDEESLFEAWERFKELLRQSPHHGIPICIQLETFYNRLVPSSRNMLDASSGGALLSKSYEEGYRLIEKKASGVHEVTETTALAAQVACVYYGGEHLFEECTANPISANYVGNNNRYNNPYNNTYNPRWRNHPNFSWSNNQETKSQFLAQGVSIKNLENQLGHIATALSSKPLGTLPSSTETSSTSRVKNVETCKIIKLRSGKECEPLAHKEADTSEVLPDKDNTEETDKSNEEPTSLDNDEDRRAEIKRGKTPESAKQPEVLTKPINENKFVQERPPPPFP